MSGNKIAILKGEYMIDYKNTLKHLDSCVFTTINPQLAKEAATVIRLLVEQRDAAIFAMHKIVTDDYEPCQFCLRPCEGHKYAAQVCYENGYEKFKWRGY